MKRQSTHVPHLHLLRGRYSPLLASLLLLFVVLPFVTLGFVGRILAALLLAAVLLSGVRAAGRVRPALPFAWILAGVGIAALVLDAFAPSPIWNHVHLIAHLLFLLLVMALLNLYLFESDRVTTDHLAGAMCIYLLIGLIWGLAYELLLLHDPGAIHFTHPRDAAAAARGELRPAIYFSLVTMTTLGYGDIVPRSSAARMMATLEAVLSQLYLAVMIARLVGMHITQSRREDSET